MSKPKSVVIGRRMPLRNPVALSEPLSRRLNAYALAAGAAGVAVLACAVPAEGEPVCKEFSAQLTHTNNFPLYLTAPAVAPFNIAQGTNSTFRSFTTTGLGTLQWWNRGFFTPNTAGAKVLLSNGLPANVASGAEIGPGGNFGKGNSYGLLFTYGKGEYTYRGGGTKLNHRGNLDLTQSDYVGFQFSESGATHYGWARLSVSFESGRGKTLHTVLHITGLGYESDANTAIAAGSCSGSEVSSSAGGVPRSVQKGAPLGLLALGSGGIGQRKE
jgi:hypothetical protein